MEAFSLLNYWKNSGNGVLSSGLTSLPPPSSDSSCRYSGEATTIVTSVTETEEEEDAGDDDGPFFDLKFAVPVEEEEESEESNEHGDEVSEDDVGGGEKDSDCTDGGCEYNFTLSSCSGGEEGVAQDLVVSPSGDVYLKGQIVEEVEVEPPSSGAEQTCSVKAPAAQLSASILKSATKLRVFMLGGTKKSKLLQAKEKSEDNNTPSQPTESQLKSTVTVDLKVEEVPIVSLFTRDNSSRNSSSSSSSPKKQNGNELVVSEDNRFVMMQKYLKKVKPLYIRVSRQYGEKLKHSGKLRLDSSAPTTTTTRVKAEEKAVSPVKKAHKPGNININLPAGFKVVRKHLGKSRSSSSTKTTTIAPSVATVTTPSESRRRDDSLLQQQDSIQSAILHCKRSFNSSRDKDPSVLPRSVSDSSSYDK